VGAERQGRCPEGVEIDRNFADRLHRVDVQRDVALPALLGKRRNMLHDTRFIVRENHRGQANPVPAKFLELFGDDLPLAIDVENLQFPAPFLQPAARLADSRMLARRQQYGCRSSRSKSEDRQIDRLGPTAGEENFLWAGVEDGGDFLPRVLERA